MTIKYEPLCGDTISNACREAVNMAIEADNQRWNLDFSVKLGEPVTVEFKFNDVTLIATPTTDPNDLANQYSEECERRSEEYFNSQEYKDSVAKYEREEAERKAVAEKRFAVTSDTFELKDPESWQKAVDANKDAYGAGVIDFASKWARLMEVEIKNGKSVAEIADECSHVADTDGITGFMYGCAVSILSQVWQYGEELRRWHNKEWQLDGEVDKANESGGVVNPALIAIE